MRDRKCGERTREACASRPASGRNEAVNFLRQSDKASEALPVVLLCLFLFSPSFHRFLRLPVKLMLTAR